MILILLLQIILLARMEFVSYPEFYVFPYLTAHHFIPYSQIIDQHFPGALFFAVNLFTLGFRHPSQLKALLALVVIFQSVYIYRLVRKFGSIKNPNWGVLAYAVYQPILAGNELWYDTLLPLFTLPALDLWLSGNLFACGLLIGTAIIFKQTILLLAIGVFLFTLFKKGKYPALNFLLGLVPPLLGCFYYFYRLYAFSDFWYWTVKFNFFVYPAVSALAPSFSNLVKISLPFVVTVLAIFQLRKVLFAQAAFLWAVLSSLGGLSRFDLTHVHASVAFMGILFGLWTGRTHRSISFFVWTTVILFFGLSLRHYRNWGQYRFFDTSTLSLASQISRITRPEEPIFLLGVQPHIYVLSNTLPAGNQFTYQLPWYLSQTAANPLSLLQNNPPRVVVMDLTASVDGHPLSSYASGLINFVAQNYHPVSSRGSAQIMVLNQVR